MAIAVEAFRVAVAGDRVLVTDPRWPLVAVADLDTLVATVLAELSPEPVDHHRNRLGGIVAVPGGVVVAPAGTGSLVRVDHDGTVTSVAAPAEPDVLTHHAGRVLGVAHGSAVLTVLEDGAGRVEEHVVGVSLTGLAATDRWIWVTEDLDGSVSVLDADTLTVAHRFEFSGADAGPVCAIGDRAWVHLGRSPVGLGPFGSRRSMLLGLDASGRRLWSRPLDGSCASVTDGAVVWTVGPLRDPELGRVTGTDPNPRPPRPTPKADTDPRTRIELLDAATGEELGAFDVVGQVAGLALTDRGLLVHGFVRSCQQSLATLVDARTGARLGELDTSGIDVRPWLTVEPVEPQLSAVEFAVRLCAALTRDLTTRGVVLDPRTDRPVGTADPLTDGFAHVLTTVEAVDGGDGGGDVVVRFRWRDDPTVYGYRAAVDELRDGWGGPGVGGAEGVLAVALMEFLDTGGLARSRRVVRDGWVELVEERPD